ncbi:MAG: tRNA pseudouridine(55) synthase TruB [Anaerotignum faecicola]
MNYLKGVLGAKVACFFYEKTETDVKGSFRGNDGYDVCALAQKFGGGGHVKAAGCHHFRTHCQSQGNGSGRGGKNAVKKNLRRYCFLDGIFNIYKEKGFTSHDVVAIVRRTIHMKKVGHTGTLDPDAEGVLPVCVGKATKLSDVIMDGRKSYRAMLRLGVTTTTEDASGEVLETKAVVFDEGKIRAAVAAFIGRLEQVPPMYSAVKVNGKKLYELAREGKEIARKARTIEVYDIRIRRFLPPDRVEMDIDCSKGTYIRTLCADIGKALGCGGHMAELLRTATGSFSLENAIKLDDLKALAEQERAEDALLTMQEALRDFPVIKIAEGSTKLLYNGGKIQEKYFTKQPKALQEDEIAAVYDFENHLVGLYTLKKEETNFYIKPFKMLV